MSKEIFSYVKLKDVADVEISSVDKKCKENEIEVSLCNFVDVYYNWAITERKADSFMKATARQSEIDRFALKKGQVAITKDSETKYDIGVATYIADDFDNVILGYHCALITPNENKLSGKYLNAFFHTKFVQKYFELNATGSGQRFTLSLDAIKDMPIYLPSLSKQKEIAEIFSKIDRKIELNEAINDNLSHMLQLIYQQRFCSNKNFKQGILSDICEYSKSKIKDLNITPYNYYSTDNMLPNKAGATQATYLPNGTLPTYCAKGDVLISNIRPYFKKIVYCQKDAGCSSDVLCFTPKNKAFSQYLFCTLYSDNFFDFMVSTSKGTKMPRGDKSQIMEFKIFIPNEEELVLFNQLSAPILDLIEANETGKTELLSLRDTLLPLLMNGQVEISN